MSAVTPSRPQAVVHAMVENDLKRSLIELARANERSEAAELRLALRRHVAGERRISQAVLFS